jgi:cobalt/nickel transport system permease protein
MHIPDGILSARVAVGSGLIAGLGVAWACARVRTAGLGAGRALLGVSAAFVFAAQLVNFPVAAGTSGHLVGAALCAALLGLPAAIVVMSAVLIVQCLAFGDGGLLALGANVFNMALVSCVVGYSVDRLACGKDPSPRRRVAAVAFAGWCATLSGATSCAEELALSGVARLGVVLPAMLGVHALIGLGEAMISGLLVASVLRLRPELLSRSGANHTRHALGSGLGLALVAALLLAPFSSAAPDGLLRVATRLGVHAQASSSHPAPFADYTLPGLGTGVLATVLVGACGALAIFGLCWLFALLVVPRRRSPAVTDRATSPIAAE